MGFKFFANAEKMQHLAAVDGGFVVFLHKVDVTLHREAEIGDIHVIEEFERLGKLIHSRFEPRNEFGNRRFIVGFLKRLWHN